VFEGLKTPRGSADRLVCRQSSGSAECRNSGTPVAPACHFYAAFVQDAEQIERLRLAICADPRRATALLTGQTWPVTE
jgi:hypothetical protein